MSNGETLIVTLFSFKDLAKTSIREVLLIDLMYMLHLYLHSCKNISSGILQKNETIKVKLSSPTGRILG